MTEVARQLNAVEGEAEGREEKEDETRTQKGWPGGVILFVYWENISR